MKYRTLIYEEIILCVLPIAFWWVRHETLPFARAAASILTHSTGIALSWFCCVWRFQRRNSAAAGWATDGLLLIGMVAVFSFSIGGMFRLLALPIGLWELLRLSSVYSLLFLLVNLIFLSELLRQEKE